MSTDRWTVVSTGRPPGLDVRATPHPARGPHRGGMTHDAPTSTTPVAQRPGTGRVLAPDLGRGLMLALIAVANVMIYLVGRPYGYRQHIIEDGLLDHVTSAVVVTLVDGRIYPLFAFFFGYGLVQMQRRGGASAGRGALRRRSVLLLLLGAVHGVLLFPGDILGWYGVVGLLLVPLLARPDRSLLRIAGLWLLPAAVVTGLVQGTATGPTRQRSFFWSFEIDDPAPAMAWRAVEWVSTPFGLLPVVTAALVGAVAARHRVLEDPTPHLRLLRRTATTGLALAVVGGLPSGLVVGGWIEAPGVVTSTALAILHALTGVAGGLGMAALVGLLARRPSVRTSRAVAAVAATGRRSLSAYLGQSVVFVPLLTLPLGGLGAHLGSFSAAVLALAVWVLTVLASAALEGAGRRGPAEWLMRRLLHR